MERDEHVTRFLHTGDWQLGMTRHFLSEGVQERFAQSRFDAIRKLGRIAEADGGKPWPLPANFPRRTIS